MFPDQMSRYWEGQISNIAEELRVSKWVIVIEGVEGRISQIVIWHMFGTSYTDHARAGNSAH